MRLGIFFVVLFLANVKGQGNGWASCFGDYESLLSANVVASGLGSFIQGEDFTYTTAICSTWQNFASGSCYQVQCTQGLSNLVCTNAVTYVRSIDSLGNACTGSGTNLHVFDLNNVPFNQLGSDGASCSGGFDVSYTPVDCIASGLVSGGIKVGLAPNQVDPWCPSFTFSNVGDSGGLYSVSVSPDGGSTWYPFKRNTGNGARWDCAGGAGNYLGQSLSFSFVSCATSSLPSSCVSSGNTLVVPNFIPSNWCANQGSPCTSNSWQASNNFGSTSNALTDEGLSANSSSVLNDERHLDSIYVALLVIASFCVVVLLVVIIFQLKKAVLTERP